MERIDFEPEKKTKIRDVSYIVIAHFDDTKEKLPEKIQRLLSTVLEAELVHLRKSDQ